ncbi:hypothetical protein BS50DRAFT_306232 [Corynespora cassiicola Philippines]|uniref:Uncharacterized protein n=1 Tax=Corynespora cassiicola Philippines TaxID=1448308 RepID=A0A2T2NXH8_CORCC|nr:hypothetical protein BS50DRAFT_306232 [Corynespora cassiicola Philippines]
MHALVRCRGLALTAPPVASSYRDAVGARDRGGDATRFCARVFLIFLALFFTVCPPLPPHAAPKPSVGQCAL